MPNPQTPQEKLKRLLAEKAECEKSLALYRKLIKTNPDAIKAPLAMTLHKLAIAFNMTLAEFLDFAALNDFSFDDEADE